jgi:Uma2 family endonuclease
MAAMTVKERMTAQEFLALPAPAKRVHHRELVDGEVVVNEPNAVHNRVQGNLYYAFRLWMGAARGRGQVYTPIDVGMDERNVFVPDLSWYGVDSGMGVDLPAPYRCPDLAVEVRSPSTWRYDVGVKKSTYERLGLPELWLVDTPVDAVLVFRRSKPDRVQFDVALELSRGETLASPLLPGLQLALAELFDLG